MKHYCLGNAHVMLHPGPVTLRPDSVTEGFLCSRPPDAEPIIFQAVEEDLSFLRQWETSVYTGGYELRHGEGRTFLLNHWATQRFAYGVYLDELHGSKPLTIYCNGESIADLQMDAMHLMGSVGLHHRLLQRSIGVLHASYIAYRGKAILFAAPSQVGKSTQAELWRRYAGARVINGDRALLCPIGGKWHAGGWLSCGSSGISENQTLPLAAIVLLEQGTDNSLRRTSGKDRLHSLLTGLESFHWDIADVDLAIAAAQRMAEQIPVLHFSCRPDEDAVRTLQEYLEVYLTGADF